jgi:hypothetical protein
MCVMCNMSNEFVKTPSMNDEGENFLAKLVPKERRKTIVYLEGSKLLKVTGQLIQACCHEICSFIIEMRRR